MKILFVHGWAGSPVLWKSLSEKLPGDHFFYDRGYFGEQKTFPNEVFDVIVFHSMGPLFEDWMQLNPAKALIFVNGFDHFCGTDPAYQRVAKRNLTSLSKSLETAPEKTIESFYESGNGTSPTFLEIPNVPRLQHDLSLLGENADASAFGIEKPTLAIFSAFDRITPDQSRKMLVNRSNSVIFEQEVTHFLPLSQPERLAGHIELWMKTQRF